MSRRFAVRVKTCVLVALLSGCCGLIEPAAAQVYKWVDEKGATHYGERPPEGQNARRLESTPPAGPASPQPKAETGQEWQDKNIEFQKRRIQRERKAEREQKEARDRQRRCVVARDDLRQMQSARLYELNEKGERVYLDDAGHKAAIDRVKQDIAKNCP